MKLRAFIAFGCIAASGGAGVGSPLGLDQSVTVGIVSGIAETRRLFRFESGERVRKYVETDAAINPGNSGGPLVSIEGEVIGLNASIDAGTAASHGFVVPINQAAEVASRLIKEGSVRYPNLGASVVGASDAPEELSARIGNSLPSPAGPVVASVTSGGPASRAGIRPGDVILEIGGQPIEKADDVVAAISMHKAGAKVTIDYLRDGSSHSAEVELGEYPGESGPAVGGAWMGVALQTLTARMAGALGLDPNTKGAAIIEVEAGGPGDKAGLAVGDVISEVGERPVATADDAAGLMAPGNVPRRLRVSSASGTRFVTVTPE